MNNSQLSNIRVFLVDSIGAHRGMHYYSFALGKALLEQGVDVRLISTPETAVHAWKPENLPIRGIFRHIYGEWPRWIRGLWYGWALLWIASLVWQQKPDLVHWHFYQIPFLDRFLLQWLKWQNIVVISTVHDVAPLDSGPFSPTKNNQHYQTLYSLSDGLIVHSNQSLASLKELDELYLAKTVLISQGHYLHVAERTQFTQEQYRQNLGLAIRSPIVLVFGSIKPNKRLDWVIEMMPDILATFPETHLIIVGKTQNQNVEPYMTLTEDLGIVESVCWHLEAVEDALLLSYFTAADVVLFPYEWIYQSAALVMAMSFGKPVVATAVGGNKDLILPDKTGALVTPGNIDEMGQALIDLLSNREKAQQIGAAAREYVATALSWEQIALETRQYYLQLTADKTELNLLAPATQCVPLPPPK